MTIKNPPPPNMLQSLAKTPQQFRDIQELRQFLYLLWQALGGGADVFADTQVQLSNLEEKTQSIAGSINDLSVSNRELIEDNTQRIAALEGSDEEEQVAVTDCAQNVFALVQKINRHLHSLIVADNQTVDPRLKRLEKMIEAERVSSLALSRLSDDLKRLNQRIHDLELACQ